MKQFYVLIGEETKGPFSFGELRAMFERGVIRWDTMYATDGAREWRPVTDMPELRSDEGPVRPPVPWWSWLIAFVVLAMLLVMIGGALAGAGAGRYAVAVLVGLPIYFIPSYVARKHKNFAAICTLNVLLGWTFVGWVVALVWALKKD